MDRKQVQLEARTLGNDGEAAVAQWYVDAGYTIVERNWRCREGELDIVARTGSTLVFCEVKSRSSAWFADPAAAVDHRKQARLRRAAFRFLQDQPWHEHLRFDVAVFVDGAITIVEDAF